MNNEVKWMTPVTTMPAAPPVRVIDINIVETSWDEIRAFMQTSINGLGRDVEFFLGYSRHDPRIDITIAVRRRVPSSKYLSTYYPHEPTKKKNYPEETPAECAIRLRKEREELREIGFC